MSQVLAVAIKEKLLANSMAASLSFRFFMVSIGFESTTLPLMPNVANNRPAKGRIVRSILGSNWCQNWQRKLNDCPIRGCGTHRARLQAGDMGFLLDTAHSQQNDDPHLRQRYRARVRHKVITLGRKGCWALVASDSKRPIAAVHREFS